MDRLLLVCLGGAVGSGARYLIALWLHQRSTYPLATWTVNIAGSFLLGFLSVVLVSSSLSAGWRLGLTAGLMGGFTTYSTFSFETFQFIHKGAYGIALVNVLVTLFICLAATAAGLMAGRALAGS